jgi:hypothetical protein
LLVANQVCAVWVDDEIKPNPTTFDSIPKRQFNVYPKSKFNKLEILDANSALYVFQWLIQFYFLKEILDGILNIKKIFQKVKKRQNENVSFRQFWMYFLRERESVFNALIHIGLLFQQLVLNIELQAMAKDLQYFRKPEMQKKIRKDCYNHLERRINKNFMTLWQWLENLESCNTDILPNLQYSNFSLLFFRNQKLPSCRKISLVFSRRFRNFTSLSPKPLGIYYITS